MAVAKSLPAAVNGGQFYTSVAGTTPGVNGAIFGEQFGGSNCNTATTPT